MTTSDSPTFTPLVTALAQESSVPVAKYNGVTVDRRRLLGAYYTPEDLAGILVEWAFEHSTGTVLDPSFGGCAFLNASLRVLAERGVKDPGILVYGVDIDSACVNYVRQSKGLKQQNCIVSDFLELQPGDIAGAPFDAIVGNPPYVRHHWLKGSTRAAARAIAEQSAVAIPATASTWAYFLVHALDFLAPGGRLAMLVPEAVLQAKYAEPIRDVLVNRFRRISLIHIHNRLFDKTDEPVVVVAGEGFGKRGKVVIETIGSAKELPNVLSGSCTRGQSPQETVSNGRSVPTPALQLLRHLESSRHVCQFSELANARIGFVTGANNHFIRDIKDIERFGLPRSARMPVVSRTTWLSGLDFTEADHEQLAKIGRKAYLVRPSRAHEVLPGIQNWIAEGEGTSAHERFKCAKREPWFRVDLPAPPDAYATCTRLGSPLLVLSRHKYRCSNALYGVYWNQNLEVEPECIAIGFLTSVMSVWAEIHGRRYGGGVLKLDLCNLAKAPIPLVASAKTAFEEINQLLRSGCETKARALADQVVLKEGLGVADRDIQSLQSALQWLVKQRIPGRTGEVDG